jgi:hypothetical protein
MRALAVVLLGHGLFFAQSPNRKPDVPADRDARWKPIEFLFGNWTGKGGGATVGQGGGDYSFEPQINHSIVVRKSFAEYTSGPDAGARHDDLMIVYADPPGSPFRAIYFDSEGHTIRYNVKTPAPNVAVFESDDTQPGPRYRLTYALNGKSLEGKFEVAAPGAEFKTYLSWSSVKK